MHFKANPDILRQTKTIKHCMANQRHFHFLWQTNTDFIFKANQSLFYNLRETEANLFLRQTNVSFLDTPRPDFILANTILLTECNPLTDWGARWLSGRVSDSGARGPGFETYRRRVVSLSKTLYSPKVLVNYPGSDGSVPTWLKNCWLGR